jgi:hypothetical protein
MLQFRSPQDEFNPVDRLARQVRQVVTHSSSVKQRVELKLARLVTWFEEPGCLIEGRQRSRDAGIHNICYKRKSKALRPRNAESGI